MLLRVLDIDDSHQQICPVWHELQPQLSPVMCPVRRGPSRHPDV